MAEGGSLADVIEPRSRGRAANAAQEVCPQGRRASRSRRAPGGPVAESAVAPPGPIPNPIVTHRSAGEY
jgi:hypothetical protein